MNQQVHFGDGCLAQFARLVRERRVGSVMLVTGRRSYTESGAGDVLGKLFEGIRVCTFSDFTENPKSGDLRNGAAVFRSNAPDLLVAVGGGSAIDMAKLISVAGQPGYDLEALLSAPHAVPPRRCAFAAVPTTAGAGSEATHFAVLYHEGTKYSVAHPSLLPDVVYLDPRLTSSLPARQTAVSGADAFCQAIESMWSVRATAESAAYAEEALTLLVDSLPAAVHAPEPGNRADVCRGAHLAGKAINISRTTASHALSYALTSLCGVPHGHAVAMILPWNFEFNTGVTEDDVVDVRGADHVRSVMERIARRLGASGTEDGPRRIVEFFRSIGLPMSMRELGIDAGMISTMTAHVNAERLGNNPRRADEERIRAILHKAYVGLQQ